MGRGMRILAAGAVFCALAAPASASTGWSQLGFVWPAQGAISTPFTPWHAGIDIGVLRSLTVRAAASGVVELAGRAVGYEGYGNIVVVRVNPSLVTIYAHLASWTVKPGEIVLPS